MEWPAPLPRKRKGEKKGIRHDPLGASRLGIGAQSLLRPIEEREVILIVQGPERPEDIHDRHGAGMVENGNWIMPDGG